MASITVKTLKIIQVIAEGGSDYFLGPDGDIWTPNGPLEIDHKRFFGEIHGYIEAIRLQNRKLLEVCKRHGIQP